MGLNDIYNQQPWTPYSGVQQRMDQGFEQVAAVPERNARLDAQRQANTDAAVTAPGAPASPERVKMVEYIKAHMRATPGHEPGFDDRLLSELQGGQGQGLQGGQAQPQGPAQGPQQYPSPPPMNQGPAQAPSGPPRGDASDMRSGLMPQPVQAPRQPLPAGAAFAAQRPQGPSIPQAQVQVQGPQTPMTNHDTDSYMRMAPFVKMDQPPKPLKDDPRERIADKALAFKREALAQRESSQARADRTKRDLAVIMARLREKLGDTDRRALIEQAKIAAGNYRAELSAIAKRQSGLGGVIYDEETKAGMEQDATQAQAELSKLDDLERALNAQPNGQSKSRSVEVKGPRNAGGTITVKNKAGETRTLTQEQYDASPHKGDWTPVGR